MTLNRNIPTAFRDPNFGYLTNLATALARHGVGVQELGFSATYEIDGSDPVGIVLYDIRVWLDPDGDDRRLQIDITPDLLEGSDWLIGHIQFWGTKKADQERHNLSAHDRLKLRSIGRLTI
jgi:hypothetical protein